jgi:hypothetical protein
MIKPKTMYECPGTGKLYDTREKALKAQRSFRAAVKKKENEEKEKQELEQCVNFVRLNARSPGEAWDMVVQRSLDIWGVRIDPGCHLSFAKSPHFSKFECRFTCSAEIADKSKFDRYQKIFMKKRIHFIDDLDDFINLTNKGFKSWGGGRIAVDNTNSKSATLELDIANFPIIESNWRVVQDQRKLIEDDKNRKRALAHAFHNKITNLEEVNSLGRDIARLNFIVKELTRKRDEIVEHNLDKFRVMLEKSIPPVEIDHELSDLFESVETSARY